MDCKNAQTLLDGYLDGELDPLRNLEIEDHLHGCTPCSQSYSDRQVIRSGLKTDSFYFKAPTDLHKRILRSVRQAAKAEAPMPWLSWSWLRVAAPVAAAALVVLMLVPFFAGPSPDDLLTRAFVPSHIRSLMVNHLADVPSTDQHTVKPWFNGKLDFSPPVDDFAGRGFPLIGGRLEYVGGRSVAALVYQRRKHLINVFLWPRTRDLTGERTPITRQGYHLLQRTSN